MKYTTLFFDADETILDFERTERNALEKTFSKYGLLYNEEIRKRYLEINDALWASFERGEITKETILYNRFRKLFKELSWDDVKKEFEEDFQKLLSAHGYTIDGAVELCKELSKQFDIYILTNGVAKVQHSRFQDSGLLPYVKDIFVSEEIGFQKPSEKYFEEVMKRVPEQDKSKILMIGDSLNSDILGGNRAGIKACWYNPKRKENNTLAKPDFEVSDYEELRNVIYEK